MSVYGADLIVHEGMVCIPRIINRIFKGCVAGAEEASIMVCILLFTCNLAVQDP